MLELRRLLSKDPTKANNVLRHYAIENDLPEALQVLIEYGVSIDGLSLGDLIFCNKTKIVRVLLHNGVDWRQSGYYGTNGFSLLHVAIHDEEITKMLLQQGADVNAQNVFGHTPFMLAAGWGFSRGVLQAMVNDRRFEPDIRDHRGRTALFRAVDIGCCEVVEFLLENSATVLIPDNNGDSPLLRALQKQHVGLLFLLIRKSPDAWWALKELLREEGDKMDT